VRQIYAAAIDRDPEERPEFLARACADNPQLRAKVEELLLRHSGDFEESHPAETMPTPAHGHPQSGSNQPGVTGLVIGPYIVQRELGRGGMGVVYLADDTRLARRVALKSLSPGLDLAVGGRERLRNEARLAAALSHPGIATVYALEEIDNQLYLACEYVPGEPLRALLASGPLPIVEVVAIGTQLAKALAAAHTQGIVHRDIKPENVIKTPSGVIKVLDFGLARAEGDRRSNLTRTGVIMGTPAYLSPEQAQGKPVDFRTDIFALGLVIYELASGVNPFMSSSVEGTIERIVKSEPVPLSSRLSARVPELDRIVSRCLQKDPAARYKSTQEMVADFDRLEADVFHDGRHAADARGSRTRIAPPTALNHTALWWWEFHQIAMASVYTMMMLPVWYVQRWVGEPPWGTVFLFGVLAAAAWGASLRLQLYFLARQVPEEVAAQRLRTLPWIRVADTAFALALGAGAVAISVAHREFAMLLITMSIVTLAGSLVIEPTTARAAFGTDAQPAH
jgi:hypothetical protein